MSNSNAESRTPYPVSRIAHHLTASTFLAHVEHYRELPSTNTRALELAGDPDLPVPCLVLADKQTQGRGRSGNVWWSSPGALTASLLLEVLSEDSNQGSGVTRQGSEGRPADSCSLTGDSSDLTPGLRLPTARWPEMSLTVGSSVCVALKRRLPDVDVRLKWPNDVYLCGKKVCGILVEVAHAGCGIRDTGYGMRDVASEVREGGRTTAHAPRVVIGIGVNINNSVQQAPEELRQRAIALCDVSGPQPLDEVLIDILGELAGQLADLSSDPERIRSLWRRLDLLTGSTVTINGGGSGGKLLTGTCVGLDDDGALLLRTESGTHPCYAGVVQSFT